MKNQDKLICEICGRKCKNFKSLGLHITNKHRVKVTDYYNQYLRKGIEGKCLECGKEVSFINLREGYRKYCSTKCLSNSKYIQNKKKDTCMKNYGVDNPSKSNKIKKKKEETSIKNYGCSYYTQTEEGKNKRKQTYIEKTRYTNPAHNPEVKRRKGKTNFKNHGVEYPMQSKEIHEKSKQTCMKNHGVEFPLQNPEIFEKYIQTTFKYKEYKMPSGEIRKVQGYENFALDILIQHFNENIIITNILDVPTINYIFGKNIHVYFPDIYITSENLLIEVKSEYTYEKEINKNLAKQQACLDQGYNFEFWVFDNKGNKMKEENYNL